MIVSFDLDDTLFVDPNSSEIEKELIFPFKYIYKEKLRKGSLELQNILNHTLNTTVLK